MHDQGERRRARSRLREEAFRARNILKHAQSLLRRLRQNLLSEQTLTENQRRLISQLETGELDKHRREANRAYGHGAGSEDAELTLDARYNGFLDKK